MDNTPSTQNILLEPGSVVAGRYEILGLLGSGGMGSVMEVRDRVLDNEVLAMKILFPHLAKDSVSFARFKNEVAVARRLGHPNIVQIYDFGEAGGGYYFITMEYLCGGNLTDEIYTHKRKFLSFNEVLRIIHDIASAIAYAHKKGVVHRDLKPDNILLGDNRELKIADFGLARTMNTDKGFTNTGETVGTPYYMAPEQLSGDEVDGRVDIYALGIIAYEMVMGRRMFFEENYLQLARQHFNEPVPDFATKESGIPRWYEEFVKKCSAKKADERYQSAQEIVDLMEEKLRQGSGNNLIKKIPAIFSFSTVNRKKGKSVFGKIFGAFLVLVFVVVFAFVFYSTPWLKGKTMSLMQNTPLAKYFGDKDNLNQEDLFAAIKLGDSEALKTFLGAGFDVNLQDENGESLLHQAVQANQSKSVDVLVDSGANVNISDDHKVTPLMLAAKYADSYIVNLLLKHNALTDFKDSDSKTPLMYAAEAGKVENMQALIDQGTLLSVRDKFGKTSLMYGVMGENINIVEILIRGRVDVNAPDFEGKTAIFYAVQKAESDITQELLNAGAKTEIMDKNGKTPLGYATTKNRKLLKSLLK